MASVHSKKRDSRKNPESLVFISYEGSRLPEDPGVRTLIRRRAMKHNATIRKQAGGYGRHNVRQLPIHLPDFKPAAGDVTPVQAGKAVLQPLVPDDEDHRTRPAMPGVTSNANARQEDGSMIVNAHSRTIPPRHSPAAFPAAAFQNYWLLQLTTPLTVLRLGVSNLTYLRSDAVCLAQTLSTMPAPMESRRLLLFIPSRYGHVASITDAVDCLVARLAQIVRSGGSLKTTEDPSALKHYVKALRSLQDAIDDENLRVTPETLFAAELLGIFELLNGASSLDKWTRHAGGAARLIELRGPENFQTEFELSLFMAHTGPIVTEAFMNGKDCFLGEDRWQEVIKAAIRGDPLIPAGQTELMIKLWVSLSGGPNKFKAVEDLVRSRTAPDESAREAFIQTLIWEHDQLQVWISLAQHYQYGRRQESWRGLAHGVASLLRDYNTSRVPFDQRFSWRVLQGTFLLCCIWKARLLFALAPSRFPEAEASSQAMAREVMLMTVEPGACGDDGLLGGIFTSEIEWVASSILNTSEIWSPGSGLVPGKVENKETGMIESWRFEAWCRAMGRKV